MCCRKTGQQGIPLVTVNTDSVKVTIYRIGDRSLIDNVLGYEFERNLYSYTLDEIADQKGEKVWTGELKVEKELNQEITTAFPVIEAVPAMQPGVYLLAAAARPMSPATITASAPRNGSSSPISGSPPIPAPTASMPSSTRSPPRRRSGTSRSG